MNWHPLEIIPLESLSTPALQKKAVVLNRRVADLNTHRVEIEDATKKRFYGKKGSPEDEAIRREIVLRTDIAKLYVDAGIETPASAANLESIKDHHATLENRGTHTHSSGGGF